METKQKSDQYLILSLIPYQVLPIRNGGHKAIVLFEQFLAQRVKLLAVTVKSNDPVNAGGLEIRNIISDSAIRYINPFIYFKLARLIKKYRVKYLMLEHPYYGWLGIILKWLTGVKLIVRSHNIEALRWKSIGKWWWPILGKYEGVVHRIADYNLFIQENDLRYAIAKYRLREERCITATYGIDLNALPGSEAKQTAKEFLREEHIIPADNTIFLFNGTLDYKPNTDALRMILEKINPILLQSGTKYKIIICGKGLPAEFGELNAYADKNIIYTGFVKDIGLYFKGADVFINPVIDGGGIKTKLVEALGWNTRAVSCVNGAVGVTAADAGEMLVLVKDNDWQNFAEEMVRTASAPSGATPVQFYQKFYWGNIADRIAGFIS